MPCCCGDERRPVVVVQPPQGLDRHLAHQLGVRVSRRRDVALGGDRLSPSTSVDGGGHDRQDATSPKRRLEMDDATRAQRRSVSVRQLRGELQPEPGHLGEHLVRRPRELRATPSASQLEANRLCLDDTDCEALLLVGIHALHQRDGELHHRAPVAIAAGVKRQGVVQLLDRVPEGGNPRAVAIHQGDREGQAGDLRPQHRAEARPVTHLPQRFLKGGQRRPGRRQRVSARLHRNRRPLGLPIAEIEQESTAPGRVGVRPVCDVAQEVERLVPARLIAGDLRLQAPGLDQPARRGIPQIDHKRGVVDDRPEDLRDLAQAFRRVRVRGPRPQRVGPLDLAGSPLDRVVASGGQPGFRSLQRRLRFPDPHRLYPGRQRRIRRHTLRNRAPHRRHRHKPDGHPHGRGRNTEPPRHDGDHRRCPRADQRSPRHGKQPYTSHRREPTRRDGMQVDAEVDGEQSGGDRCEPGRRRQG